ncbi:MAG: hypothetical protein N2111_06860 [Candidatus Sumerlaeaceae bacterium]|nr:hypothetical protein [Candidatus Sumerlaeaceae bacterium]
MVRRKAIIGCMTGAVVALSLAAHSAPRTYRVIQTDEGTRVERINQSLIRRLLSLPDRFVLIRIHRNPKGVSGFDKAITQKDMEKPPKVSETIRRSARGLLSTVERIPGANIVPDPVDSDPAPRGRRSRR